MILILAKTTLHLIMTCDFECLAHQWEADCDCDSWVQEGLSTTCRLLWRWREHSVRGALCAHKGRSHP